MFPPSSAHRLLFVHVLLAICLFGCNKSDKLDVYPVEGTVTAKGKPAAGVQVSFFGTDPELMAPTAPFPKAVTGEDGTFTLTSYEPNDGAPAGNYIVTLVWPASDSDDPEIQDSSIDRLRGKYSDAETSSIKVTIEPSENQLNPFEL